MTVSKDLNSPKGYAFVAALVLLVLVMAWRYGVLTGRRPAAPAAGTPAATTGANPADAYLVYRTYTVKTPRTQTWANDDVVRHEFWRFPLGQAAAVPESLAAVLQDNAKGYGAPWMTPRGESDLLFVRREKAGNDAVFIGPDGQEIPDLGPYVRDFDALPSPDGRSVAAADPTDAAAIRVSVVAGGSTKTYKSAVRPPVGRLTPLVWSADSAELYLKPVLEGENVSSSVGLWRLTLATGKIQEIAAVRQSGLMSFNVYPERNLVVGSTYRCDDLEHCGVGPSKLFLVNLGTGEASVLLENQDLGIANPMLSPDGLHVAYTFFGGVHDIFVAAVDNPDKDTRPFLSGQALAWTPDGTALVVDRDNSLQVVSLADKRIITIARRAGRYQDPDFQGLDYVGIVRVK